MMVSAVDSNSASIGSSVGLLIAFVLSGTRYGDKFILKSGAMEFWLVCSMRRSCRESANEGSVRLLFCFRHSPSITLNSIWLIPGEEVFPKNINGIMNNFLSLHCFIRYLE